MRVRAVLTDLDGTLLEPDGSVCAEVRAVLAELTRLAVPVCPLTSKTATEVRAIVRTLALDAPASFENGAGVLRQDGTVELQPGAVPLAELLSVSVLVRTATGAPMRTILDLSDAELTALAGLQDAQLAAARDRQATLPLFVDAPWDDAIRAALPAQPSLRVVRGNRFLHLQGAHDKGGSVPRLIELSPYRAGATIACGDSPNDAELLARADVPVIVPGATGPNPDLLSRFPGARVAPLANGRGWAAIIRELLAEDLAPAPPGGDPQDPHAKTRTVRRQATADG
jgi:mannosyl-3-phosphoglycerate phosphatase